MYIEVYLAKVILYFQCTKEKEKRWHIQLADTVACSAWIINQSSRSTNATTPTPVPIVIDRPTPMYQCNGFAE